MNLRKILIVGGIMLQVMSSSCAKIDKFNTPHMLEGFTGIVKVTPGIAGITARTYSPGLVFFNSNKDGTEVTLYGPNTENFSLYSILPDSGDTQKQLRDQMEKKGINELDKLDFSGFRARVDETDGKKITFYDFGDQSEGMRKFKWVVTGKGFMDGPDSHAVITISTTIGTLQDLLPNIILKKLAAPDSDVSIAEFEERNAVVHLARIEILATGLTIAN
jgi:hypothetical protein